jgi:hypothetical protein
MPTIELLSSTPNKNNQQLVVRQPNQQKKRKPRRKQKGKQRNNNNNSLMVTTMTKAPVSNGYNGAVKSARFQSSKNGNVIVCHSELIGDVQGTQLFTPISYSINPGLTNVFLWLCNVAQNYESYKFKKLRFRFIPACSTDNAGTVYTSVDFDATDPLPSTERQMASYQGTKFSPPWRAQTYDCLAANLHKRTTFFVRSGPITSNENVGLFDTGNFIIATVGCDAVTVGKLWVDYEVEFSTPDFPITGVGRALSGRVSTTDNFVTAPTQVGNAPIISSATGGTLTLTATQPYAAIIALSVTGAGLTAAAVGGTGAEVIRSQGIVAGGTGLTASIAVTFSAPQQTLTVTLAATSVTATALRIGQYDTSLL